jgi:hypothetical protein
MKKTKFKNTERLPIARFALLLLAVFMIVGFAWLDARRADASAPSGGTIGAVSGASTAWVGTASGIPPAAANGEQDCDTPLVPGGPTASCDLYTLTVSPGVWGTKRIKIEFTWTNSALDYDMVVRKESGAHDGFQVDEDAVVGTSGNGATNTILNYERVDVAPPDAGGIYYVRAVYYAAPAAGEQYNGKATVIDVPSNDPAPPSTCALPSFDNYQPPSTIVNYNNAAEPSIGVNWNTGNVMIQERLTSVRATFPDSTSPADPNAVKWFAARPPGERTGLDPILFTDSATGRTIGGELQGAGGGTNGGFSDDDLNTFTQTFASGGAVQGVDHQTIGAGPPNRNIVGRQPVTSYPNLFYYASQQIAYGSVATSFDGGVTYGSAVPAYTLAQCGGLHGHIKVAPDGTVYLPNKNCGGKAAVIVSEDNGLNWSVRTIPTSSYSSPGDDPSVHVGAGGKVYVTYTDANKHPHAVISDDRGLNWHDDYDLGLSIPNFRAAAFPAAVAGDNNRAAIFFIGTDSTSAADPTGTDGAPATGPDTNPADNFFGTWYPYIATTCDGGKSWSVVKADNDPRRPGLKNPVQQGVVCKNGTTCPGGPPPTRNLADFNDVTVDAKGRILAAYADGCVTTTCIGFTDNSVDKSSNDGSATATIIRQRGGMRLFSAFDANGPAAPPLSPPAEVISESNGRKLQWTTPDDSGSPLKAYRIYRGVEGAGEKMIAEVKADVHTFRDRSAAPLGGTYYRVTAVNAHGESPRNVKAVESKGE